MSFLVLWSICLSSSFVHFKNGPKYLTRRTVQVFIPLMRFLLYTLLSSSFPILLKYSFWIFSFISTSSMVSASNIPKYLHVSFSTSILISSSFGNSIAYIMCRFLLLIVSMTHFSIPNSIPISRLNILTICIRFSNCISFLVNSLMSSLYIRWLIFSCDLVSLYPPVHWVASLLSQILMVIAHLPGRFLAGFSPQVSFFLMLSIQLSSFPWFSQ